MKPPIDRDDMVFAGGDFGLDRFVTTPMVLRMFPHQRMELRGLDGMGVWVRRDSCQCKVFADDDFSGCFELADFPTTSHASPRKLAQLIEGSDPALAKVLRRDYCDWAMEEAARRHSLVPMLSEEEVRGFGYDVDALLYVAAQQPDAHLLWQHYRALGADPLRPTFEGDCAARVAVSRGLVVAMESPEIVNAVDQRNGCTGLHALAWAELIGPLVQAVARGGDPFFANNLGDTPMGVLPFGQGEVEEAYANYREQRLAVVLPASAVWSPKPESNNSLAQRICRVAAQGEGVASRSSQATGRIRF